MSIPTPHLSCPPRAGSRRQLYLAHQHPTQPEPVGRGRPGDAASVLDELQRSGASLAAILLTHNHSGHIGGVPELLRHWDVPVIGPDDARIAQRTLTTREGERCELPDLGLSFRHLSWASAVLLLAACATPPAKAPPEHAAIVIPSTAAAQAPVEPPDTVASAAGVTPSLTMPREWQHHNGEDYADRRAIDAVIAPYVHTQTTGHHIGKRARTA
jgi:hypothetical protein